MNLTCFKGKRILFSAMMWFHKSKKGIETRTKRDIPTDLWVKCEGCNETLYRRDLESNLWVCGNCNGHFRIDSQRYIKIMVNPDTWEETDAGIRSVDPLKFEDTKKYSDRLLSAMKKTGRNEAITTGLGTIEEIPAAFGFMDFGFIGGSMGSVVGEKFARVVRLAIELKRPLVAFSASGGARMMEGALSLMQMAKTSAALGQLSEAGLPYISVLTHPTTGGVTASFAMLGDVHLAEPHALIGFAGPRVIRETIRQELPEGFQQSEFLLDHGFVDQIVDRRQMKQTIGVVLRHLGAGLPTTPTKKKSSSSASSSTGSRRTSKREAAS